MQAASEHERPDDRRRETERESAYRQTARTVAGVTSSRMMAIAPDAPTRFDACTRTRDARSMPCSFRAVALALVVLSMSGCRSDDGPLPAVVTFEGVAGITTARTSSGVSVTAADVREAWDVEMPLIETSEGSTNVEIGLVCADDQQGALIFVYDNLHEMRFSSGALTDRGVGNGSTLAELREAYGSRLERLSSSSFRVRSPGPPPRHAIVFDLGPNNRVATVRFGWASLIPSPYAEFVYQASC